MAKVNMNNIVITTGRLVNSPKGNFKEEASGERKLLNVWLTLGVDREGKDAGTDFPQYVAFDNVADFLMRNSVPNKEKGLAPMFRKGARVRITGEVRTSKLEVNGKITYPTSLVARDIDILSDPMPLEIWEQKQTGGEQAGGETPAPAPVPATPTSAPAPAPEQAEAPQMTAQQQIDAAFPFPG